MQLNEAFKLISDKVGEALAPMGFTQVKADSAKANELVALFVSENVAYSVIYYKDKMHTLLRECAMTDEGPDNDWKTLATWMFDPDTDGQKEANSIANDFVEAISAPVAQKRAKQMKKSKGKKKDDDGNADPLFLSKRFMTLFPELKDEIKQEEECYNPFRGVTFARASIVPRVNDLVKKGNKADLKKLGSILSAQYTNGDVDTRSIITIVILNSIPEEQDEVISEYLSDDLKTAFKHAKKYRNKEVKPEKEKKKKPTMAQRLDRYNNQ
ncbi:MAG: hypothetical protein IJ639_02370 [Ruminococcus sp.]|nr:hypothetical protein [Ruminococcus sp.]